MLEIEYKGGNAVVVSTKKTKVVVNPKLTGIGLKDLATKDAVELTTEPGLALGGETRLSIDGPGEYEVGDFSIRGVNAQHYLSTDSASEPRATMYRLEAGDIRVAIVGNVAPNISESQYEELGVVDVLIVPVGSGSTLDAVAAAAIARQVDAKAVIPVHYADPAINYEMPSDGVDVFKKELSAPVETVAKYKLKTASALPEVLTVVEVERS